MASSSSPVPAPTTAVSKDGNCIEYTNNCIASSTQHDWFPSDISESEEFSYSNDESETWSTTPMPSSEESESETGKDEQERT